MSNDKEDIKLANIDQHLLATLNWTSQNKLLATLNWISQNKLLAESCSTFREVTFSESEFLANTPVSKTWYKHSGIQNNNPFYPFNNHLDNESAHYFAESETTKWNVDKFLTNLLMEFIIRKLSYCNISE